MEAMRRPQLQADANITEALAAVNTALNVPAPSTSVGAILSRSRAKLSALVAEQRQPSRADTDEASTVASPTRGVLAFWLMAAAVERFVATEGAGLLPTLGTIPDMTAETSSYVTLQQIYAAQAGSDLAAVQGHAREIAALEGLPADLVSTDELKRFCKNAHAVQVLPYRSLASEWVADAPSGGADAPSPPAGLAAHLEGALNRFRQGEQRRRLSVPAAARRPALSQRAIALARSHGR